MKLSDFLTSIGVATCTLRPGISPDSTVIIMPEESDGYDVKDIIYFQNEKQMWLVIDEFGDRWLTQEEENDSPPEDEPVEREGDMCCLPDVAEEPKVDICEQNGRRKARRA